MATIKLAKTALRKEIKTAISRLSEDEKCRQSSSVTKQLLSDSWYIDAKNISIYLHMGDEIKTLEILTDALRCGKRCYIPKYFMGGNRMEMVLLKDLHDYHTLPMTKWNIKQPTDDDMREEALENGGLDLMLVPGMAFTEDGKRLGRGKGYYDTYLSKATNNQISATKTIALAFKEQIVTDIPVDDHDFFIDRVLHET